MVRAIYQLTICHPRRRTGGTPLHLESSSVHVGLAQMFVRHSGNAADHTLASRDNKNRSPSPYRMILLQGVPGIKEEGCGCVLFKLTIWLKLFECRYQVQSHGTSAGGPCEIDSKLRRREEAVRDACDEG